MSEPRLYGNWLRPQRASLRGISVRIAVLVAVGYFAGLVLLQTHPRTALALLGGGGGLVLVSAVRVDGASLTDAVGARLRWRFAILTGRTRFLTGLDGRWLLPGPMAATRMIDVRLGPASYGAVLDSQARRIAVSLDVTSTAADLTDPGEHDADVSRWERWLEGLGRRPEVAWVDVHVETAPASGTLLQEAVQQRLSALAPIDCRELMTELAARSPAAASRIGTRVTIVFDLRAWDAEVGRAGRRAGPDAHLPVLDRTVAALESALGGCGVLVTGRSTTRELGAAVRSAFDPAAAGRIELVLADARREIPPWAQAGPAQADEHRDRYVHDSGTSASFVWAQAPRQLVTSRVLDPLTRPGRFRKRVTVTYVPTPAGQAMDAATLQVRRRRLAQALAALPVVGRASTAQDEHDNEAAEQAGYEVAAGAGWIAQTITATVTVLDDADLPTAIADLEQAAGTSQLRLRPLFEMQAAGFVAGLPVGLSLTELARRWQR